MSDAAGGRPVAEACVGLGAFVSALALASAMSIEADRLRLPAPPPSAGLEARIPGALAVRRFAADRGWIETLQYCGDMAFIVERGRRLARMSDATTNLDPRFEEAYAFGAAMLMWQCRRPEEAAALLRKGIAYNPRAVRLEYYLAAFTYGRLKDLAHEVAVLEVLARDPGAPFILRRILANAYEKQGRLDRAVLVWRLIWLTTANPDERRWVAVKCARYRIDPAKFRGRHAGNAGK
jgi:tetratricopeptide (TPR) repeat protein